jgi:hypothetical protein
MKGILAVVGLIMLCSCSGSAGGSSDTAPLVGHWSWYQLTVKNQGNPTYQNSPSTCIGEADVMADGTFKIWNICKEANNSAKSEAEATGTWFRTGTNTYKGCYNKCFNIMLNKDGTAAMFASTSTEDQFNAGLYEFGHMFKDIYFSHDAVK